MANWDVQLSGNMGQIKVEVVVWAVVIKDIMNVWMSMHTDHNILGIMASIV